jgi:hypothetical protein
MNATGITVRWVTGESEATSLAQAAGKGGGTVLEQQTWEPGPDDLDDYGDAAFEPLTAVVIVVATGWLIKRISDVVADHKRPGGQLVDARGDVVVRPLPQLKTGTLVLVTKQETRVFAPDQHDTALDALTKLLASPNG